MLITNAIKHVKPYITMCVGMAKFTYSNKHNILVIMINSAVIAYKNGQLLGLFSGSEIYTRHTNWLWSEGDDTATWTACRLCGWGTITAHNIPFYDFDDYLSIFGFRVTQYKRDYGNFIPSFWNLYESIQFNS